MPEITLAAADGAGTFACHLVRPRSEAPAGAVVLIQEIFGVNASMRAQADWVASLGFLAIVPDLFWRQEPGVQLDPDAGQADWQRAFALMQGMDQELALADLTVTLAAARMLDGANGRAGTLGFCLGGRLAFLMAARSDAECNVSYYGVGIETLLGEAATIRAPLLLHIAAQDKFVPPAAQAAIVAGLAGRAEVAAHVYPGVDHAFARAGGHAWDARAATIAHGRSAELLVRTLG